MLSAHCLGGWVPEGASAQKGVSLANEPETVGEVTPSQHRADPVGGSRNPTVILFSP